MEKFAIGHRYRKSLYENENSMKKETHKCRCFIKNVDFSLEKCRFGTNKGVLHYVLKRELALPTKKFDFELEKCVNERGGRAARCMGSVPVAEMLASEARASPPTVAVS